MERLAKSITNRLRLRFDTFRPPVRIIAFVYNFAIMCPITGVSRCLIQSNLKRSIDLSVVLQCSDVTCKRSLAQYVLRVNNNLCAQCVCRRGRILSERCNYLIYRSFTRRATKLIANAPMCPRFSLPAIGSISPICSSDGHDDVILPGET